MLGRRRKTAPREDPAVAEVERILRDAAPRADLESVSPQRVVVAHALWICACITVEDSPTWLIYDSAEAGVTWGRVRDGVEPLLLLDAQLSAGGHTDPVDVLRWLRGEAASPWGGPGTGGDPSGVVTHLGPRLVQRRPESGDRPV